MPASVGFLKEDGKVVEPILATTLQLKHRDRIPDEDLGATACKVSLDFSTSLQDLSDSILRSAFPIWPRLFAEHFVPGSWTTKGCTVKYCIHVNGNLRHLSPVQCLLILLSVGKSCPPNSNVLKEPQIGHLVFHQGSIKAVVMKCHEH